MIPSSPSINLLKPNYPSSLHFSNKQLILIFYYESTMNRNQGYDCLIKLLIIGNSGVGKTNMLLQFCENNFMTSHLTTIGIDFKTKTILLGKDKIRLQIWDTAGQEKFKTITQTYYRGAMGIILTYAINERETFQDI